MSHIWSKWVSLTSPSTGIIQQRVQVHQYWESLAKGCCVEVISISLISFPLPYEDCKRAKALRRDSLSFKWQREVGNNRRSTRLPRPLPVIISCCSETRPAHSYTISHNQPTTAPVIQTPAKPAAGKLYHVWCLRWTSEPVSLTKRRTDGTVTFSMYRQTNRLRRHDVLWDLTERNLDANHYGHHTPTEAISK